jgi:cobalamin biosynthesis protein CobD/CbiB
MKTTIDRIYKFYHRYRNLVKRIDAKTTMKTSTKSVLGALLISFLIILLPSILVINMFIYTKLTFILSVILLVFVLGWVFLYYHFYYILIKNYHEDIKEINTRIPQYVEATLSAFVLLILGIVVLATVF